MCLFELFWLKTSQSTIFGKSFEVVRSQQSKNACDAKFWRKKEGIMLLDDQLFIIVSTNRPNR